MPHSLGAHETPWEKVSGKALSAQRHQRKCLKVPRTGRRCSGNRCSAICCKRIDHALPDRAVVVVADFHGASPCLVATIVRCAEPKRLVAIQVLPLLGKQTKRLRAFDRSTAEALIQLRHAAIELGPLRRVGAHGLNYSCQRGDISTAGVGSELRRFVDSVSRRSCAGQAGESHQPGQRKGEFLSQTCLTSKVQRVDLAAVYTGSPILAQRPGDPGLYTQPYG